MRASVAIALVSSMGCNAILGISDPVAGSTPNDGGPDVDAGPRVLESISIEPDPLIVPLGLTKRLEARGHFSDGTAPHTKLLGILSDAQLAADLGRRNQERAIQQFSIENMIGQYERLYYLLAARKSQNFFAVLRTL